MKFNHLNVPTHWQSYWTRFPEGHTILEALISWVSQVDSMVDNQNNLNDNVEQFRNEIDEFVSRFDERLQDEVTTILQDWQTSGFLDVVISEALQWQLDDYIATNDQDKLSLNTQLQQINHKSKINNAITFINRHVFNGVNTSEPLKYFEVGDSTRASNGAHVYKSIKKVLNGVGVFTELVAQSGLKTEHFSKTTINLQPGFPTVDNVLKKINDDGFSSIVNISLGTNDGSKTRTEIKQYLQTTIDSLRNSKPNIKIILTSPNRTENSVLSKNLTEIYRELSEENNLDYINVMEDVFPNFATYTRNTYFLDGTHPNENGQIKMASYILSVLLPTALKLDTIKTKLVPVNHYVRVATGVITNKFNGFYGELNVNVIPGTTLRESGFKWKFGVTQTTDFGEQANIVSEYVITGYSGSQKDVNNNSLIIRTRESIEGYTLVDFYIKNVSTSVRYYEVTFNGGSNQLDDLATFVLTKADPSANMIASNTTIPDVTSKPYQYVFIGSPDGTLRSLQIDNSGNQVMIVR